MDFDRSKVLEYLSKSYNSEDIDTFCFDFFPEVFRNFTDSMSKPIKILRLLDHVENHGKQRYLINALKKKRPEQFESVLSRKLPAQEAINDLIFQRRPVLVLLTLLSLLVLVLIQGLPANFNGRRTVSPTSVRDMVPPGGTGTDVSSSISEVTSASMAVLTKNDSSSFCVSTELLRVEGVPGFTLSDGSFLRFINMQSFEVHSDNLETGVSIIITLKDGSTESVSSPDMQIGTAVQDRPQQQTSLGNLRDVEFVPGVCED